MTSLKLKRICIGFTANIIDYWENSTLVKTNPIGPKAVDNVYITPNPNLNFNV